ncbi:carboxypeptidase-like regulatory domain-containing protein [Ilyomonas limi]|uniref:Carboxypeptidase-like regulatory domain-containing protein n=1 Tax=Ilyomonas limi TaxID=2575867 RepID=A0A4V6XAU2_9BACT|nr:carboxypeptidase-like regulatory domain-containing protein [Ilyomonas limi]TKK67153.1 carboxypeptidase-like regulatory domain-containing protein [Ilyomonas limi]
MAEADKHITYTLADIQRYLQGGMTAKEMHELERAALEDPFLADALEGYRQANMQQAQTHLSQIERAIQQPQQQGKVVPLPRYRKYQSWQVAAAVVLLACIGSISFFIYFKKANNAMLAKNESSTMLQQDSVQMHVQQVVPPVNDTTAIKTDSAEKAPAEKDQRLLAKNKKRIISKKQPSAAQATAPMTAMTNDNNTAAAQSANSVMAMRAPARVLTGTITDNKQQPVPNAKIILQDSTAAVTDRDGNFRIATTDSTVTASISALGYKPLQKQSLRGGYNRIVLKERPFLLSDVEVINIGTADKKVADTTATMPEGGWQSFREYVYNKLQKKYDTTLTNAYIDGDLQLEFSINDSGEPSDFKVLHAPDSQTANEAISAIKTGPRWTTGDRKNKLRITLRYK